MSKREREVPEQNDERLVETLREQVACLQRENAELRRRLTEQETSHKAVIIRIKEQQMTKNVDTFFQKNSNRPMKALWEALTEIGTPDLELPMAIVMDSRCGIERRVDSVDDLSNDIGLQMEGATPLTLAVRAKRNDVVEALLALEADYNASDNEGTSVFMMAALSDNVTAMELLARSGADIEMVDSAGDTALHYVVESDEALIGNAISIKALCSYGANIGVFNRDGDTVLHLATNCGGDTVIEALLGFGANMEAVNECGRTPLQDAAVSGSVGAIEALVREGASILAKDEDGKTPLDLFSKRSDSYRKKMNDSEVSTIKALLTPKVSSRPVKGTRKPTIVTST